MKHGFRARRGEAVRQQVETRKRKRRRLRRFIAGLSRANPGCAVEFTPVVYSVLTGRALRDVVSGRTIPAGVRNL